MWKDIEGYEGLYQVNEVGEIRSVKQYKESKTRSQERIISQHVKSDKYGRKYMHITLWKNNKKRNLFVHRLVAIAFIPNPENKLTVDHIDCDPSNNTIDNLRWATHKEQSQHMVMCGNGNGGLKCKVYSINYKDGTTIKCNGLKDVATHLNCGLTTIGNFMNNKNSRLLNDLNVKSIT